ncbi:MAG: 3-deoxy-D-manno-octulosonic acid kinase [Gammaproteobacteria bacterium]|nr:3-deoxy-D-manno-octulosonic acid kinase [Gammaproteobacteria bacterium]MDH5630265.1 3-deoxy-D-manno-octulosonic acid kinase [Gammaproteobacteria bacterium]
MLITHLSKNKNHLIIPESSSTFSEQIESCWFDIEFWKERNAISGFSKGRSTTWFLNSESITATSESWVLKHYYRGGMVARFLHDKYFYLGVKNTRAWQEIKLTQLMLQSNLPVPKTIAAQIKRDGIFYTADIITQKIDNANNLVEYLKQMPLEKSVWRHIGQMVRQFHLAGILHADLNAHNILLDEKGKLWLIDFDKCYKTAPHASWQQSNLERLKRSFLKELNNNVIQHFDGENWQSLVEGYSS